MQVISFTPHLLYSQGKNAQCPLYRRLSELESQTKSHQKKKNLLPLLEITSSATCFLPSAGKSPPPNYDKNIYV
jgi:hypothetical protein